MVDVLISKGDIYMGELNFPVTSEIKMPEKIVIPPHVAEGIRKGLAELEGAVATEEPEALVIILRKAALLGKAIRKRLPEIPMVEAPIGRKFMGRYMNTERNLGYDFDYYSDGKPIIDNDDYINWLKHDHEAICVAAKLREDLCKQGVTNPEVITGLDDTSYFEFVKKLTWPTIIRMAFGESIETPFLTICKGNWFDWLTDIITTNFGYDGTDFTRSFLHEVVIGRFYGTGETVKNEEDLRKISGFLRRVHHGYKFPVAGDIEVTPQTADYFVSLHKRIEDSLEGIA